MLSHGRIKTVKQKIDALGLAGVAFLHLVAPELVYPFGQLPHLALPLEFMHLRALSQPPLFFAHGLGFFTSVLGS